MLDGAVVGMSHFRAGVKYLCLAGPYQMLSASKLWASAAALLFLLLILFARAVGSHGSEKELRGQDT